VRNPDTALLQPVGPRQAQAEDGDHFRNRHAGDKVSAFDGLLPASGLSTTRRSRGPGMGPSRRCGSAAPARRGGRILNMLHIIPGPRSG
jgi:hypothetical protein